MTFFNKEDLIKWNDISTSLQDIIMRKITWNMLHPDLQSWLLDKERRINDLERWRRVKVDPMLDNHERRINTLESQVTNLFGKLGRAENDIDKLKTDDSTDDDSGKGKFYINEFEFGPRYGFIHFSNNFQMCWLPVLIDKNDYYTSSSGKRIPGTIVPLRLPTGRVVNFKSINEYECIMTTDERGLMEIQDQLEIMYCRAYTTNSIACATFRLDYQRYVDNNQTVFCWGRSS